MIAPLTDKAVNINCDPAFLLNADEWRSLESPVDGLIENEYVLCYLIHIPIWFNDWAKNLKKTCGKKIVFVGLNGRLPVFCDKYIRDAGPREFLWLIDHAYAVVSSSFHGNVFSLIFGKGLISTPDQKRPDRIRNLLRLFKQEHREMRGASDQYHLEAIDADGVKNIATALQKEAKEYLLNAFEGYEK